MKKIHLNQKQTDSIINDYLNNDMTIGAIAKKMKLNFPIVKRVITENCPVKHNPKSKSSESITEQLDYQNKCYRLIAYANKITMNEGNSGKMIESVLDEISKNTSIINILKTINEHREFIELKTFGDIPINKDNKTQEEWQESVDTTNRWISWITNSLYMGDGSLWYDRDGMTRIIETNGKMKNDFLIKNRLKFFTSEHPDNPIQNNAVEWYNNEKPIINELYDTIALLSNGNLKDDVVKKFNIECAKITKLYFESHQDHSQLNIPKITVTIPNPSNNDFIEIEL